MLAFLRDLTEPDRRERLQVVELAAGSGRLGFHFLSSFRELLERSPLAGQRFRYVLTDLSGSQLEAWSRHPRFAPWLDSGELDVARFDVERDGVLRLEKSGEELAPGGVAGPLVVLANYAFDSLPQDAFAVRRGTLLECRLKLGVRVGNPGEGAVSLDPVSLDLLELSWDYRPVSLPYYDDPWLDGLLAEYLRELGEGHFLMPITAMRGLRALTALADRLLLLSADFGEHRLQAFEGAPPPRATRHGSIGLAVNYHALGRLVEDLGGVALLPSSAEGRFVVSASLFGFGRGELRETRLAFEETLTALGSRGFCDLESQLAKRLPEMSLAEVLAFTRFCRWDATVVQRCLPRLLELAGGTTPEAREEIRTMLERTWSGYFCVAGDGDLAFELGALAAAFGLHDDALGFFEHSLAEDGEHSATCFNLALGHHHARRPEAAEAACRRALELDPANAGAKELLERIAAGRTATALIDDAGDVVAAEPRPAGEEPASPYGSAREHLAAELDVLVLLLRRELGQRRGKPLGEDDGLETLGFRLADLGSPERVAPRLPELSPPPSPASPELRAEVHRLREWASHDAGVRLPLPELASRLGLDDFERSVLVLALVAELDRRCERLFRFLDEGADRRWPSVGLALAIFAGGSEQQGARRAAFHGDAPLLAQRLVRLVEPAGEPTPPIRALGIALEPRTSSYLLGVEAPDAALAGLVERVPLVDADLVDDPVVDADLADDDSAVDDETARHEIARLRSALDDGASPVVLLDGPDGRQLRQVARQLAGSLLVLDGRALAQADDPDALAARALREAALTGATLFVEAVGSLIESATAGVALRRLVTAPASGPRFLADAEARILPEGLTTPVRGLHVPAPGHAARRELWRQALAGLDVSVDLTELASRFRFRSAQIESAAGRIRAGTAEGAVVTGQEIFAACRAQCSASLGSLARRIESIHGWDDLVLPARVKTDLEKIERWLRFRHVVYEDWGFGERVHVGRGLATMFSGSSGTGKTMAAGIIARALDLDLYAVDLSSIVSKYVGETEKNLARVFDAAESAHAILFFDEADALFGKRSTVKDAHDRYAKIEVGYLLQRMETYDGIAILATNIRGNVDAAFSRRLQVVEFPFPDADSRERIWRRLLPASVPQGDDVDLEFLAQHFNLAGGNIKSCAVDAALAAAADGGVVRMQHLVRAVAGDLKKLGKPVNRAVFGPHAVHL